MTPETIAEVETAIHSLLNAHWSPTKIATQLASNSSYGKQGACFPVVKRMAEDAAKSK